MPKDTCKKTKSKTPLAFVFVVAFLVDVMMMMMRGDFLLLFEYYY